MKLAKNDTQKSLLAKAYDSGFELAHDSYQSLSRASDGKLYYVLSSESLEKGGQLFRFDPEREQIDWLADLTEACGESERNAIPQGKSHVPFFESGRKLYFGTHVGYYEMIQGMERLPENPPNGLKRYPGGHFLCWNLETEILEDLGMVPNGEGILSLAMDTQRNQMYALTWPYGNFIHFDPESKEILQVASIAEKGEAGFPGKDYRVLCRSMLVDPDNGKVYFTNAEGDIFSYSPYLKSKPEKLRNVHMRRDYFGDYDPKIPGDMGYNWRKILWHGSENTAYGIHGNSGYLFRFNPKKEQLEVIDRLCSLPSKRSGMFDQFSYGYLGFDLAPDGETLHYLTGAPVGDGLYERKKIAKGAAKALENLHWVTYHIPSGKYTDHGPVYYPDGNIPTYVNSLALDEAQQVYALARMKKPWGEIQDLIKLQPGNSS